MTTAVRGDHLTRRFGARRGVTDVSFEVGAGEVFGFLGPNGAGKSTTIRLLVLSTYSQMLRRALARIGWPYARVHDLRYAGMTLAAEAGASLAT